MLRLLATRVVARPAARSTTQFRSALLPAHRASAQYFSSEINSGGERERLETLSAEEVKDMPLQDLQDLLVSTSGKSAEPRRNGLRKKRMNLRNRAKIKEHRIRKRQVIASNKRKHEKRQLKIKQTQRWTEYLVKGGNAEVKSASISGEATA